MHRRRESVAQPLIDTACELLVGGQWVRTENCMPVRNKYSGQIMGWAGESGEKHAEMAVRAARKAAGGPTPSLRQRAEWLTRAAALVKDRLDSFSYTIAGESGKPIRSARAEVMRAVETLTVAAGEAMRISGHEVPVAAAAGASNRMGFTMRFPLGVVCAITPFNYPLNLACHKIAPALAAGNAVVWKPSSATPLTAIMLARVLVEAGVPDGFLNLVIGSGSKVGDFLLRDPRIDFYTFTGSLRVGLHIRRAIGIRRATFELGSNCGVIVHSDADLDMAARSCADGAFSYSGQNCDAVQRIYIHSGIYHSFKEKFISAARSLNTGDPFDEATDLGPMISAEAAASAREMVMSAVRSGAGLLAGGHLAGSVLDPTILENVPKDHPLVREEIFAPVVSLFPYSDINEAIAMINDSRYGLQAGIFTQDLNVAWHAVRSLQVGGVLVNESSCYRVDLMPFGGAKESGVGREGPRYAIEEMTEQRLIVFNL